MASVLPQLNDVYPEMEDEAFLNTDWYVNSISSTKFWFIAFSIILYFNGVSQQYELNCLSSKSGEGGSMRGEIIQSRAS